MILHGQLKKHSYKTCSDSRFLCFNDYDTLIFSIPKSILSLRTHAMSLVDRSLPALRTVSTLGRTLPWLFRLHLRGLVPSLQECCAHSKGDLRFQSMVGGARVDTSTIALLPDAASIQLHGSANGTFANPPCPRVVNPKPPSPCQLESTIHSPKVVAPALSISWHLLPISHGIFQG